LEIRHFLHIVTFAIVEDDLKHPVGKLDGIGGTPSRIAVWVSIALFDAFAAGLRPAADGSVPLVRKG